MKKILLLIMFLCFPLMVEAVTMQEYRDAVAGVGISTGSNYGDEFIYSYFFDGTVDNPKDISYKTTKVWLERAKNGMKSSGLKYGFKSDPGVQGRFENKFAVYCESFVKLMVHHASNGAVSYDDDYEKIKVSEIRRGDLIHFRHHIAIFIDDGNDDSIYTNTVAHGSTKIEYVLLNNEPDYGYRLKEEALAKLDYNYVTSSYDFHDRLDDEPAVISNVSVVSGTNKIKIEATDYKKYDLAEKLDVVEPENSGIVAYQITEKDITPTTDWKKITKTTNLNLEVELSKNGTYYVWLKDVGGNVTKKQVNLTTLSFDKIAPTIGGLRYNTFEDSIEVIVNGAYDNTGIKEYKYYLDNELIYSGSENKYLYKNLENNQIYKVHYEVVDTSGNTSKSTIFEIKTGVDANKITVEKNYIELLKGNNYTINPKIDIDSNNYVVEYKSDNTSIASVNKNGTIYAVNPGFANITISVGDTKQIIQVKVLKYDIKIITESLPAAYVGEKYEALIMTNMNTTISLKSGTLPNGLRVENNKIVGSPTDLALGKYTFYLSATYDDESVQKEFIINVYKEQGSFDTIIVIAIIIVILAIGFVFIKFKPKNNEI